MDERFDQVEGQIADARTEMRTTASSLRAEVKELHDDLKANTIELRGEIKEQGKEFRGELAGVEARLRAQASEHYVKTREELARIHNDNQQMHAELHAFQRAIVQVGGGMVASLIVALVGLLIASL